MLIEDFSQNSSETKPDKPSFFSCCAYTQDSPSSESILFSAIYFPVLKNASDDSLCYIIWKKASVTKLLLSVKQSKRWQSLLFERDEC
jgi:hypothetical protein